MTEEGAPNVVSLSREEFEKEVARRARADGAFREQLLADPKAALQSTYGVQLPPDVELHVLEETPSRFYMVLHAQAETLSDEQLAAVAGGVMAAAEKPRLDYTWLGGVVLLKEHRELPLIQKF